MSDELNKRHLNYQPNIQYQDEYTSDIEYRDNANNIPDTSIDEGKQEVDNLIEDMNEIKDIVNGLPGSVSDSVSDIYDQIFDFVDDELTDKVVTEVPSEDQ